MKNKKTKCKLCNKKHESKTSKYCKDHRDVYVNFRNSVYFKELLKYVKVAGSTQVISTSFEDHVQLLKLLEFQKKAQWRSNGKLKFIYDKAHLFPASPSNGRVGTFTADNLMLVPSHLNRGLGNKNFGLPYGRSVKLHSAYSVKGKDKKLKKDSEIIPLILKRLGESLIKAIWDLKNTYNKVLKKVYKTQSDSRAYTQDQTGKFPAEVLAHELARLGKLYPEVDKLNHSIGRITTQSYSEGLLSEKESDLINSILIGDLESWTEWNPLQIRVIEDTSEKYSKMKVSDYWIVDKELVCESAELPWCYDSSGYEKLRALG